MSHYTPPRVLCLIAALCIVASACASPNEPVAEAPAADGPQYGDSLDEFAEASPPSTAAGSTPPAGFTEIVWEDLIPPGSTAAEINERFDERIAAVEPGSPEANEVYTELQAEYENQPANPAIADQEILLAGFIAPLTYSGELVTEFLLVPYFGACVHVPPPPPNQTVLVSLAEGEGLTIEDSWGAVWVTGTMTLESATTDLAAAAYTISGAQTGVHNDY